MINIPDRSLDSLHSVRPSGNSQNSQGQVTDISNFFSTTVTCSKDQSTLQYQYTTSSLIYTESINVFPHFRKQSFAPQYFKQFLLFVLFMNLHQVPQTLSQLQSNTHWSRCTAWSYLADSDHSLLSVFVRENLVHVHAVSADDSEIHLCVPPHVSVSGLDSPDWGSRLG